MLELVGKVGGRRMITNMFELRVELNACQHPRLAIAAQVVESRGRERTEDRLRLVSDTRVLRVLRASHDLEASWKLYQSISISSELSYHHGGFIGGTNLSKCDMYACQGLDRVLNTIGTSAPPRKL